MNNYTCPPAKAKHRADDIKGRKWGKIIHSQRTKPLEDKGFISRTGLWVQVLGYGAGQCASR